MKDIYGMILGLVVLLIGILIANPIVLAAVAYIIGFCLAGIILD